MKRLLQNMVKPPNILIKTDKTQVFLAQKKLFDSALRKETYTVYQILDKHFCTQPWLGSCALMICEGNLTSSQFDIIKKYLESYDGRFIFHNAHELIAEKVFIENFKTLSKNCEKGVTLYRNDDGNSVTAVLDGVITSLSNIKVEEILRNLSIRVKKDDEEVSICEVGTLFSTENHVSIDDIFGNCEYYFAHRILNGQGLKLAFMKDINEDYFKYDSNVLKFCSESNNSCVFNWTLFKHCLKTKFLGHNLMYTDLITSTQDIFTKFNISQIKKDGLVVTARQQYQGKGRSGNQWLSPVGCMMFSTQIDIPLKSNLGAKLPYIQHIAMVAFLKSIKQRVGYSNLDINIKWPNDIYIKKSTKIGGVIVNSSYWKGVFKVAIGLGVNVSNEKPTDCLNSLILEYNKVNNTNLKQIPLEDALAGTLNEIENLVNMFQRENGLEEFKTEYYRYWMHSGADVMVECYDNDVGRIVGLDEFGYLLVEFKNGKCSSLQPDGNSFDMMKNLIKIKN